MCGKGLNTQRSLELLLKYSIEDNRDKTDEFFNQLIALDPKNNMLNDYFKYKLTNLKNGGKTKKISEYIGRAKRNMDENDPISMFNLGYTYNTLYETAKIYGEPFSMAVNIFKQILSIDEKFIGAYGGLKETAISASHEFPELLHDTERYMKRGIELFPNDPFINKQYGELLDRGFGRERKRESLIYYKKSLKYNFYDPQIHLAVAGIYRILSENEKAIYHYMVVNELSWNENMKNDSIRALNYLKKKG